MKQTYYLSDPDELNPVILPILKWIDFINGDAIATDELVQLIECFYFENWQAMTDKQLQLLRMKYLNDPLYKDYQRKERRAIIRIIITVILLISVFILLITADPAKIDNFLM